MSFRPATTEDEGLFFKWRQLGELEARAQGWWRGSQTGTAEHHRWFLERLRTATLLVWVDEGEVSGCARIDSNGEVAFDTSHSRRPRLLEELKPYADVYGGRLKATVDLDDPKWEALEDSGFEEFAVRFYVYRP